MPNYGLVVTPTYNPMSFEEYAKPFQLYSEAYNKMADAYDQLELEAGQWEKLRDNAQDQEQWNVANKYLTDLRDAAEDLATNGLNLNTRGKVSNLRGRYSKEIVPISDAWSRREKERELQTQMRLQHPDIMFERDAFNTGLNSYIAGNPEMRSYNGALITKNVSDAASNLARELSSEISSGKNRDYWYTILGGQYYEKAIKTGLTASDVISAMRNPDGTFKPEANVFLSRIMEDAVDMTGMKNWSNWEDVADRAYDYAETGLWSAIGQTDYKNLQNRNWDLTHKSSDKDTDAPAKLWDWMGKDVDVNGTNKEIRQSADDLDFLQRVMQNGIPEEKTKTVKYPDAYKELNAVSDRMRDYADKATQEAKLNGVEWNPDTDASYRAIYAIYERALAAAQTRASMPNMPALVQTEIITDNPDYKRFVDLQNKYGVTDPTELYNAHHNAHNEFIKVNKYTVLNNTVGTRVMRYLGNQVTSGMNDETLKEVIWQEDKKGKKTEANPETARKALSSKDSTIQINFNNGKVRINNTEMGTFYLDKSALHNLTIPVIVEASTPAIIKQMLGIDVNGTAGVIPGDTYIDNVVQLQQYMRNAGYSEAQIDTATNEFIENFYTHLEANTRNMTPESPVTSSRL